MAHAFVKEKACPYKCFICFTLFHNRDSAARFQGVGTPFALIAVDYAMNVPKRKGEEKEFHEKRTGFFAY
jgi:hypothetical protein